MYSLELDATLNVAHAAVWQTWTDISSFPDWDPREEEATLNGPFAVGSTVHSKQRGNPGGEATIVAIEDGHRWTVAKPLPGGRLVIDHRLEPVGEQYVRVVKRYDVYGPIALVFRLVFAPKIRQSMPASFEALEREARRRALVTAA